MAISFSTRNGKQIAWLIQLRKIDRNVTGRLRTPGSRELSLAAS
ncbi:MAG TPA: hypothetical protein VGM88_21505 [Kofleriaceae bacterium]|jgi:hypothetical protein